MMANQIQKTMYILTMVWEKITIYDVSHGLSFLARHKSYGIVKGFPFCTGYVTILYSYSDLSSHDMLHHLH